MKETNDNNKIQDIIDTLPDNKLITHDILALIGNKNTKVEQDKDIKNSYYVYLKDTIYLADNEKNNKGKDRLCLIAHECRHSMQSKSLQKINFILSNIQILVSIICLILSFCIKSNSIIYSYIIASILTVIPRLILEIDAVIFSTKILEAYLDLKVSENEKNIVTKEYVRKTRTFLPLFILSLLDKRIIIAGIIILIHILV